ncbi:hypothetical protein DKN63_23830 [Salmonella enterica]|nr:hypothetical protein [Salmonella enterica]
MLRIEPLRVSPLRAAAANASGLRPPRSAWPPGVALRAPLGLRALPSALALGGWRQRQPGSPVSPLPGHEAVPLAGVVPPMSAVKPGAAGCKQTLRSSC